MKACPVKIVKGIGPVQCAVADATHVTIRIPGPSPELTLPVILSGKRDDSGAWTWNGDTEKPTLRPSVKTTGHDFLCHTWVNDGEAQYLSDCTHDLRGQTVPLLDVECDHDWKLRDDSFDHEYGTEQIFVEWCQYCNAERPHESGDSSELSPENVQRLASADENLNYTEK